MDPAERGAGADAHDRNRWRKRARVGWRIGRLQIVPCEHPQRHGGDDRIRA
jgi:hypothetical protein